MSLQHIQTEFADILLSEDESTDLLQPLQNMSIYRNNVRSSLINTLLNTYPLMIKLVGQDFFRIAAKDYIKQYPSCSSNLHDYGQYFSDFLASYPPVKSLTYLAEVAHFEWICHTLDFAADHPPFDIQFLEKLSPDAYPRLHFVLHPASQVVHFHYPILRIIELCKEENQEMIDINTGGNHLLIIRRDLDIKLVLLEAAESAFLMALQEGLPLFQALKAANAIEPDFKLDEKLPAWIQDKTIVEGYAALD
jgi:hypothetical protein